jgi:hypothetical protein
MKKAADMSPDEMRRDEERGKETARRWIAGGGLATVLSDAQLRNLGRNLETFTNNSAELVCLDEHADPATDLYAALTGDLDCRSRATVRAFWERVLGADPEGYSECFLVGFAFGVQGHVC